MAILSRISQRRPGWQAGLLWLLFIFNFSVLYGQAKKNVSEHDLFKPQKYWGITVTSGLATKASIQGDKEKYSLESAPQLCFEALWNLYYDFALHYSLVFGAGGGVVGYNFDYIIPKDMFEPPTGSDITSNGAASREMDLFYVTLPVELEGRWPAKNDNKWNVNIGVNLRLAPGQEVGSEHLVYLDNNSLYKYLEIQQQNGNNGKAWLNAHIAGGYSWKLRNNHLLRVNLKLNVSRTDFGSAAYTFMLPGQPLTTGNYGVSGSAIGLSAGYLFSR